jgi:hypothetical protein
MNHNTARTQDIGFLLMFFCTGKIQGGQDRVFLFRGGLVNNKEL